MSSYCKYKSYSHFSAKNINVYAIFNDQSFNDTLANDIASFEQLDPGVYSVLLAWGSSVYLLSSKLYIYASLETSG